MSLASDLPGVRSASGVPVWRKRRMASLFGADGRTLIIAMDHLSKLGRGPILRAPGRVIGEVVAAGVDAVMLRHGLAAQHAAALQRTGLILTLEHTLDTWDYAIEHAMRSGADGVKVVAFPGSVDAPRSRASLAPLAAGCDAWGLPLMAEMIPVSFADKAAHTPENILSSARLASDMGADIVKVHYTGDVSSMADVVEAAGAPVVVLGGSGGGPASLLTQVRQALDAGAAGAAIGRRVWNDERPGRVAGALSRLIHEDVSLDRALAEWSGITVGP